MVIFEAVVGCGVECFSPLFTYTKLKERYKHPSVRRHQMETRRGYETHVNVSREASKTGMSKPAFSLPARNQFQLSTLTNVSS